MNETKPIIMDINSFANRCGYFHNAFLTDNISYNNGYNCRHPLQEETFEDEDSGKCIGGCFSWSCPLGYPPDTEELVKFGVISEPDESDLDYLLITDEETLKRLNKRKENFYDK